MCDSNLLNAAKQQAARPVQAEEYKHDVRQGVGISAGNARDTYYRASLLEEMEKTQHAQATSSALRAEGITFLRENPEFIHFIDLIRKGVISI